MFKVLVCGSRDWTDKALVYETLDDLLDDHETKDLVIIEGGAPGADSYAQDWAADNNVINHTFMANWKEHGKAAGPIRNQQMINQNPDLVIAFSELPISRGTSHTVGLAEKKNLQVKVISH